MTKLATVEMLVSASAAALRLLHDDNARTREDGSVRTREVVSCRFDADTFQFGLVTALPGIRSVADVFP